MSVLITLACGLVVGKTESQRPVALVDAQASAPLAPAWEAPVAGVVRARTPRRRVVVVRRSRAS